jgi:hypothetical protein
MVQETVSVLERSVHQLRPNQCPLSNLHANRSTAHDLAEFPVGSQSDALDYRVTAKFPAGLGSRSDVPEHPASAKSPAESAAARSDVRDDRDQ